MDKDISNTTDSEIHTAYRKGYKEGYIKGIKIGQRLFDLDPQVFAEGADKIGMNAHTNQGGNMDNHEIRDNGLKALGKAYKEVKMQWPTPKDEDKSWGEYTERGANKS